MCVFVKYMYVYIYISAIYNIFNGASLSPPPDVPPLKMGGMSIFRGKRKA